jgi:prepilin-type N-terminal cleavage/methylation domain-containing protein
VTARPVISRPSVDGEHGFSLIEVLVAALILAAVVGGGVTLLIDGGNSAVAAQRDSQLISVADQQIETIREEVKTKGFDELAMSALPGTASNATLPYSSTTYADPNHFVSSGTGTCGTYNTGYDIEANYDNSSSGLASGVTPWSGCTAGAEPLEVIPAVTPYVAGFVSPGPTTVSLGSTGQTVTVDEYVTDTYVGCGGSTASITCPTTTTGSVVCPTTIGWPSSTASSTTCADARRLIVAVIPSSTGRYDVGQTSPVYVSTIFTNPSPSNSASGTLGLTLGLQLG